MSQQDALIHEAATQLRRQMPAADPSRADAASDRVLRNGVKMRALTRLLDEVAGTDESLLVWGESGVGKDIVVATVHTLSRRRFGPLVKVNCAARPVEVLESELFGEEPGAAGGARQPKPSKFALADLGTIVLDEVAEVPLPLQSKLAQVLRDGHLPRSGSRRDVRVDVRVVAVTNKDLRVMVRAGSFRNDLLSRLAVAVIHVPPLRERRDEIPALLDHYLRRNARAYGRPAPTLSGDMLCDLLDYDWPGNVRELENVAMRLVVLGSDAFIAEEIAPAITAPAPDKPAALDAGRGLREIAREAVREAERAVVIATLERVRWHRREAARRLRVSYRTLLAKMKEHGVDVSC